MELSPFEMVMGWQVPHQVNFFCKTFIDHFSLEQEAVIIEYFYMKSYVNYRAMFYRGERFREVTDLLLTKFSDPESAKERVFQKVLSDPASDAQRNALFNLYE